MRRKKRRTGEGDGPRGEESSQVMRDEAQIGETRLALENNGDSVREPSISARMHDGIAVANEKLMTS